MSAIEQIHTHAVMDRRVRVLADHLGALLPREARVLDVGCGDGRLARALVALRPDLSVRGVDVLVREDAAIEVEAFDGQTLPVPDDGVDAVLFVDVLHHTEHAEALLAEAKRAARTCVVLKDHLLRGPLAGATLRFMDRVGNARHGVALPHLYWPKTQWRHTFSTLGLEVEAWETRLGLYPFPASLLFDRNLHFVARLGVSKPSAREGDAA